MVLQVPCSRDAVLATLADLCVSLIADEARQVEMARTSVGGQKRRRLANRSSVNAKSVVHMREVLLDLLSVQPPVELCQSLALWAVSTASRMGQALVASNTADPTARSSPLSMPDLIAQRAAHGVFGPVLEVLLEAVRCNPQGPAEATRSIVDLLMTDGQGGDETWTIGFLCVHFPACALPLIHMRFLVRASSNTQLEQWAFDLLEYVAETVPSPFVDSVHWLLGEYSRNHLQEEGWFAAPMFSFGPVVGHEYTLTYLTNVLIRGSVGLRSVLPSLLQLPVEVLSRLAGSALEGKGLPSEVPSELSHSLLQSHEAACEIIARLLDISASAEQGSSLKAASGKLFQDIVEHLSHIDRPFSAWYVF